MPRAASYFAKILAGCWVACALGQAPAIAACRPNDAGGAHLGLGVTPAHFPNHSVADLSDAFDLACEQSSHAIIIIQWSALGSGSLDALLSEAARVGLEPVVAISPTTLDQGRQELDLPASLRQAAGSNVSFANPLIRDAFVAAARDLAAREPLLLALATEINFLAARPDEYLHFVSLYKEAYAAVKSVSPATEVFVSFQWEHMRLIDDLDPAGIPDHGAVIDVFRPELDLVALTTYPGPSAGDPDALPDDYYRAVFRHLPTDERILLSEVGWPSAGSGSPDEQRRFIERLPELLTGLRLVGLDWALLHDVDLFDADLNSVGLIENGGTPKPAFEAFETLTLPEPGSGLGLLGAGLALSLLRGAVSQADASKRSRTSALASSRGPQESIA